MSKWYVLLFVVGCGGGQAGSVASSTTTPPPAPAVAVQLPPSPACEPRDGFPEGLHDRAQFQDPATEKVGFKDQAGTVVIPATYVATYNFSPRGLAAAIDGTTPFVFIDPRGAVVAKAYAYDNGPDYYQEGFARFVGANGKIGYFSEAAATLDIAPQFDDAAPFCNGKAQVRIGSDAFEIDTKGARVP